LAPSGAAQLGSSPPFSFITNPKPLFRRWYPPKARITFLNVPGLPFGSLRTLLLLDRVSVADSTCQDLRSQARNHLERVRFLYGLFFLSHKVTFSSPPPQSFFGSPFRRSGPACARHLEPALPSPPGTQLLILLSNFVPHQVKRDVAAISLFVGLVSSAFPWKPFFPYFGDGALSLVAANKEGCLAEVFLHLFILELGPPPFRLNEPI